MSGSTAMRAAKPKKSLVWTVLHKWGTPLTAGLFLVSTISGVALFFRWGQGLFHSMHEWLSMVLLVPFLLHMAKNWRPIVGYAKRKTGATLFILCVLAAIPFMLPKQQGRNGNPGFRVISMVRQAPLTDVAPIFKTAPEQLVGRLKAAGYQVTDASQSIDEVAAASNVDSNALIATLLASGRDRNRDGKAGDSQQGERQGRGPRS